jgi:hypothetical protein
MAIVVNDTFTDTTGKALASAGGGHTGEVGATWTKVDTGGMRISNANAVYVFDGNQGFLYTASGTPATAQYDIDVDFVVKTLVTGHYYEIVMVSGTDQMYLTYQAGEHFWTLQQYVSAVETSIATAVSQTLSAATTYHVKFERRTGSQRILLDGAQIMLGTGTGFTAIGSVGFAGFITSPAPGETTGIHFDNLVVTEFLGLPARRTMVGQAVKRASLY